jgi:hypothetical protein
MKIADLKAQLSAGRIVATTSFASDLRTTPETAVDDSLIIMDSSVSKTRAEVLFQEIKELKSKLNYQL